MKLLISFIPFFLALAFEFATQDKNIKLTSYNKQPLSGNLADSSEEILPPAGITNFAGMFNERGYYKSNQFSFNEQEIVNDFNGNLMYQIPLYNFALAGDLSFNVSLNYNGSVGHQFILGNTASYEVSPERYNMNAPEWIISLNGIAIQVYNFEANFFTTKNAINQATRNNIHKLIPGFHFDSRLQAADVTPNRILILAGDGSIISLVRKSIAPEPDSLYVGDYEYEGKELYYKAKVTYLETGPIGYRRRKVEMMRGDGAAFIFREYKRNFADFPTDASVNDRRKPMMLLLEEIKDQYGHYITISYDFDFNDPVHKDGRPVLDSINGYGYMKDNISLRFIIGVQTTRIINSSEVNGDYYFHYLPINFFPGNTNHSASINRVQSPVNQYCYINYENYRRTFNNLPYYTTGDVDVIDTLKRITYFKNFLGKSSFYTYGGPNYIDVTYNANNLKLKSSNEYVGYGRDRFYTNMLSGITTKDSSTSKSLQGFSFNYTPSGSGQDIDSNDIYYSERSIFSLESSTLNQSKDTIFTKRTYKTYPIFSELNPNFEQPDIQGITKLLTESSFYNNNQLYPFEINNYNYDRGSFVDNIFTGSFLLVQNQNLRRTGQAPTLSRIWNYTYTYQQNDPNKPLLSKQEVDPLNNKNKITYQNSYLPNLIHKKSNDTINKLRDDTTSFYKIMLPLTEEKMDANNNLMSKKSYEYISSTTDNNGYYGQLIKEKLFNNYNQNDYIQAEYQYYKNDFYGNEVYRIDSNFYPFKEGNLKLIIKPNGQEEKYFYTAVSLSEIYPPNIVSSPIRNWKIKLKKKFNTGLVLDTGKLIWDGRFPIRIDNYKVNASQRDTLSKVYKSYTLDGSPSSIISQNKFLTEFQYTPVHRISSITLPNDFSYSAGVGGTIKYTYDDIKHRINIYSVRNTVTGDKSRIAYSLDGFGNIKQKDIFTSGTDSNSYKYKFNYMNKPAENLDALNQSTKMSYDGLEHLISTQNPDASFTFNDFSYISSILNYFDDAYNGFIEKQLFTDEEGNHFEKYFDAVGNLLREVKWAYEEPSDAITIIMTTDYKYDSLYRLTRVKTPEGKNIYYSYDGYGRQSKRITVDAGQIDFIYDKNSNLTFSQDANQRNVNIYKYTFRNYDGLNRLTGIGEYLLTGGTGPSGDDQYNSNQPDNYLTVNVYDTVSNSVVTNLFTSLPSGYAGQNFTKGNLAATAYRTRSTDNWSYKYYRYDERGRVIKQWNVIDGIATKIVSYEYNSQDQITKLYYNTGADYKRFRYSYDYAGRLNNTEYYTQIESSDNPINYVNFTSYTYNPNSQVAEQGYDNYFLSNGYTYNNRGWISELYNSDSKFIFNMDYYKNGNVKTLSMLGNYADNFQNNSATEFTYTYDRSNRLLNTYNTLSSDIAFEVYNTYDRDGNILTLKRYDSEGKAGDDFNYSYYSGTNKLSKVSGTVNQYTYDLNGNMTKDTLNKNSSMKYDHRNLLIELYSADKEETSRPYTYATRYFYDEAGNRIRRLTFVNEGEKPEEILDWNDINNPGNDWALHKNEFYIRGVDGKELAIYNDSTLLQWNVYGLDNVGKLVGSKKYYYMKDHLGSVRATLDEERNTVSAQDYDMWGYILDDRTYESDESIYKFTGKERDEETTYDYFGARYYDSRIGRWGQVEPKVENVYSWSSFVYCIDNPLRVIDPLGLDWFYSEETKKWEYIENASFMINVNYDFGTGNTTTSVQQGEKEFLKFEGSALTWYYPQGLIRMWNARSGILDDQNRTQPELQNEISKGPIPEGWYNIDPKAAHYYPYEIGKGKLWKIWPNNPNELTLRDWGMGWVPLNPTRGNNTTRSNFFIHGGLIPGSIGCIDLMGGINDFLIEFINHGKTLNVNVQY